MKSYYVKDYDAFVRYFDIAGGSDDDSARVYLAGLSSPSTAIWLDIATHHLVRGRRSLLIDYIGSGFSDKSTNFDHAMAHHAEYVAEILDHEGLSGCEILGHSMGGTIGIYLALQRPDLVNKLIMAESNLAGGGGPGTRYIASFSEEQWLYDEYPAYMTLLRKKAREGDTNAAMNVGAWEASDPYGIYWQSRSLVALSDEFTEQALNLNIPTAFIYGDKNLPENNDGKIFPDSPEPDTLTSRGIHVGVVPNSGHMMMVDNLDGFAEVVAEALSI